MYSSHQAYIRENPMEECCTLIEEVLVTGLKLCGKGRVLLTD